MHPFFWSVAAFAGQTVSPLVAGRASVEQLKDTDSGYVAAQTASHLNGSGLPTILLLVLLAAIWYAPLRRRLAASQVAGQASLALAAAALLGLIVPRAGANVTDHDEVEFVQVKANQTAFLVPQEGKNNEGQAAFDSESYLEKTKIAEKRIQILHQKMPKWGWFNSDKYIPTTVLYVVTRQPYVRQWLKEADRGTSAKNEGFFVESKESLNINFGVSIGAHIEVANAAKYLFHFGVSDQVNQGDSPEFPSEVYAKPLAEVMDTTVHQRVQTLLFDQFGKNAFDDCLTKKIEMMAAVEAAIKEEYAKLGITVDYVGYATELGFDPTIQAAINKVYVSRKEAEAANSVMQSVPARNALAEVQIKESAASAISKWDGHLSVPSVLLLSDELAHSLGGMFHAPAPEPTPAKTNR